MRYLRRALLLALMSVFMINVSIVPAFSEIIVPMVFPVAGNCNYTDTFGAPRGGGARTHEAIDLMAAKMTPLVAVVSGKIGWLNDGTDTSTANGLPYYNLMLHGDDGNDYYYIHLNNDTPGTDDGAGGLSNAYAPGITNGVRVTAGQHIAYVGDSGNAEEVAPHLHFEIHLGGYKNPVNPYASLVIAQGGSLFKDMQSGVWYSQYVNALFKLGIINGYNDGTFKPGNPVTRAEFMKMVTMISGIKPSVSYGGYFADVPSGHWAWSYIEAAQTSGIVDSKTLANFRPDEPISRAEAAEVIVKASSMAENPAGEPFADITSDFWCYIPIMTAKNSGIIYGYPDGTFKPLNPISRAEASKIIHTICK